MEDTFKLEIISPEKIIFSDNVKMVTLPSYEGEMGILKNHIPIIGKFLLYIGIILAIFSILTTKKTVKYLYILWGQSIRISQMKLLKSL